MFSSAEIFWQLGRGSFSADCRSLSSIATDWLFASFL
jgi:hypothetical protein